MAGGIVVWIILDDTDTRTKLMRPALFEIWSTRTAFASQTQGIVSNMYNMVSKFHSSIATSIKIKQILQLPHGNSVHKLPTTKDYWGLLTTVDYWGLLRTTEDYWGLLRTTEDYWGLSDSWLLTPDCWLLTTDWLLRTTDWLLTDCLTADYWLLTI